MPKKSENIYFRKDGRWEGRYISDYSTKPVQYGYVYGGSYDEVKDKLFIQTNAIGFSNTEQNMTFCEASCAWLNDSRIMWKESTYSKYYHLVNDTADRLIGSLNLNQVSSPVIQKIVNNMLDNGISRVTAKDFVLVVNHTLSYAKKKKHICSDKVDIVYPKKQNRNIRVLSRFKQQEFVSELYKSMGFTELGIMLALYTGLRSGELCALQWKDIDLDLQTLFVRKTMQRIQNRDTNSDNKEKTKIIITAPKSDKSFRAIPIPTFISELLADFKCSDKGAYLLTGKSDKFVEPRTLQNRFKKHTNNCGLSDVNFHALRHTFTTRCIELGFDVNSLSEILGHASVTTTLNLYVHSSFDLKLANMNKLNEIGI